MICHLPHLYVVDPECMVQETQSFIHLVACAEDMLYPLHVVGDGYSEVFDVVFVFHGVTAELVVAFAGSVAFVDVDSGALL